MKTIKTNNQELIQAIKQIVEAVKVFQKHGQSNPLQSGFLKEFVMAQILNHEVVIDKHLADGIFGDDFFEYLTCSSSAKTQTFAFDGMKNGDDESMNKSLSRISRNKEVIFTVFDGLIPLEMYKVNSSLVHDFVKDNLIRRKTSKNNEHTVNISLKWVKQNCEVVKF